jgi:hypothetical protein
MAHKKTSPTMLKALRLAAADGALRRLPGGYWVSRTSTLTKLDREAFDAGDWVGTTTVYSCVDRGFMTQNGDRIAHITTLGHTMLGELS